MTRTRVSMTVLCSSVAVGLLTLLSTTVSFAEEPLDKGTESSSTALELLQAEVLDTVSLARAVHFVTPEVTDTVAKVRERITCSRRGSIA